MSHSTSEDGDEDPDRSAGIVPDVVREPPVKVSPTEASVPVTEVDVMNLTVAGTNAVREVTVVPEVGSIDPVDVRVFDRPHVHEPVTEPTDDPAQVPRTTSSPLQASAEEDSFIGSLGFILVVSFAGSRSNGGREHRTVVTETAIVTRMVVGLVPTELTDPVLDEPIAPVKAADFEGVPSEASLVSVTLETPEED